MLKSGENISPSSEGLKAELLQRPLPDKYKLLSPDVFIGFPQIFSRYLESVSQEKVFHSDTFGNAQYYVFVDDIRNVLAEDHLTELGRALHGSVKGKEFVDLGCGHPNASILPRQLAKIWNARRYIGIDSNLSIDNLSVEKDESGNIFESVHIKSDMLSFLARIQRFEHGVNFYLAGLEPRRLFDEESLEYVKKYNQQDYELDQQTRAYIKACMEEIKRISKKGDGIIIGPATYGFDPKQIDFQVQAEDYHHVLYVKQND